MSSFTWMRVCKVLIVMAFLGFADTFLDGHTFLIFIAGLYAADLIRYVETSDVWKEKAG